MLNENPPIVVVDDESSMRHMLRLVLERQGYKVSEATNGEEALKLFQDEGSVLALSDIRMPGMDGLALIREVQRRQLPVTLIMMSAYGSIDSAIECMKAGAYDYVSKPFKPDEVVLTIKKAEERLKLRTENAQLKAELKFEHSGWGEELIFESPAMAKIKVLVDTVAKTGSSVLITGETGTGKELVARALHRQSERSGKPFVAVNCGAIAPSLMESELFGHAKGAFTGADRERPGLFIAATGGTLFLDEIGELPLDLQPKLLRVLQEGEVRRIGEAKSRKIDVRVIAATGKNLQQEAGDGRFRDDLFYRIAVVEVYIPPLRERREDIGVLAKYFLRLLASREGRHPPLLTENALDMLQDYDWPGNVRELKNLMEKTLIFCRGEKVDLNALPWETRRKNRSTENGLSLKEATTRLEREFISKALAATNGNRTHAAHLLEISLRSLQYKMKEYDMD